MARRLHRNLPAAAWRDVTDPRDPRGLRYGLAELLQILTLGMCTGALTLRDVENLAKDIVGVRRFGIKGCPSDTALDTLTRDVNPDEVRPVIHRQVRKMHRSKQLCVLPISLVAIDGKALGSDKTQKHPQAQLQHHHGQESYTLRALRAVHTGSELKPIIDQMIIPADAGEANTFIPFMGDLLDAYGRSDLIECVSVDAGFTSRENMHWLNEQGIGFIAALKGDQPTLFDEARRILGVGQKEPWDGWEVVVEDVTGSRVTTRWFSRTRQMVGYHDWTCIRQVWRVRQRTVQSGRESWDDRYFLTNLPWGRLRPKQCLASVRAHWGIENDANWTMDAIWREDSRCWVRMGTAMELLGLLRILAFNLVRLLRHRVLKGPDGELLPFRRLLELMRIALCTPMEDAAGFG